MTPSSSRSSAPQHPAALEFLAIAGQFKLGSLDTEQQHPLTQQLSHQAQQDLPAAYAALTAVDVLALEAFCAKAALLPPLAAALAETLEAGRRVFLCGCGATGRLSLSLEVFCREGLIPERFREQVIGFMSGGDLALIKAIEKFEDRPDYGARQLQELGFQDGDLLVSSTEGGETPFVIGATEFAAQHSRNQPWFLYCNPDAELAAVAERSQRVLENPRIHKLNLAVGPMAISGSTRMQSSTVLMAAIGFCFESLADPAQAATGPARLLALVETTDLTPLAAFTAAESAAYQQGEHVLYQPGAYGITVLTDTTERSPTFTLLAFENQQDPTAPASWCHLWLLGQPDGAAAWQALLHRTPRTLEWEEVRQIAGAEVLKGYDFSDLLPALRATRTKGAKHHIFAISDEPAGVRLTFKEHSHLLALPGVPSLYRHLMLKMALNDHSTLVMGRLGRYEDNLMTYVKPSNNKLIDRAIRYVRQILARQDGLHPDYETVAHTLFHERDLMAPDEPIVLRTRAALLKQVL